MIIYLFFLALGLIFAWIVGVFLLFRRMIRALKYQAEPPKPLTSLFEELYPKSIIEYPDTGESGSTYDYEFETLAEKRP